MKGKTRAHLHSLLVLNDPQFISPDEIPPSKVVNLWHRGIKKGFFLGYSDVGSLNKYLNKLSFSGRVRAPIVGATWSATNKEFTASPRQIQDDDTLTLKGCLCGRGGRRQFHHQQPTRQAYLPVQTPPWYYLQNKRPEQRKIIKQHFRYLSVARNHNHE